MPWTTRDVDRHKQGLTAAQKRQWVRVANAALKACMNKGGTDATCAPSAIRQANGVVGNTKNNSMEKYLQVNTDYQIRTEEHNGKKHIVVPVVMMVEGVHNGSHGPLFHPAEELGKFPGAWDGMPVMVHHPQENGQNVSANSPDQIKRLVGRVYNTRMDGEKLKAEAWLDEEKLSTQSALALAAIRQQRNLDVSVGVFTEDEESSGAWHEEEYTYIARNHRPDHLALLPGGEGACSWEDGCGIRLNKKGGTDVKDEKDGAFTRMVKDLNKNGFVVHAMLSNEQGKRELVTAIQSKLDAMDNDMRTHYLEEVYDDYFIYRIRKEGDGDTPLYKLTYNVADNEEVEFGDDPVEVKKKVEYVTLESNGFKRTKPPKTNVKPKTKEAQMSDKKKTPCPDKVNALINHELTKYTEEDKEWLQTLEENQLDKMIPNEPKKEEKPEEKPQINAEEVLKTLSWDEIKKKMPEKERDQYDSAIKLHNEARGKMIKSILDNTEDVWEEDELKEKGYNDLAKIYKSIGVEEEEVVDYSGQSGKKPNINTESTEDALYPAGIEVKEEKEEK